MSVLKKMPNEKGLRRFRHAVWAVIILFVAGLACLKQFGEPAGLPLVTLLEVALTAAIVTSLLMENHFRHHQRCPKCSRTMDEVPEEAHPQAEDYHILYCERCDTIWDTTIPKSTD